MAIALAFAPQVASAPAWTWTLYPDSPVVLAQEVPDTARLNTTFECEPGSSIAKLTFHEAAPAAGVARVTSGEATAMGEVMAGRRGASSIMLRTDHPSFAGFAGSGRLTVTVGQDSREIDMPAEHLPRLRRFSELCAG